MMRPKCESVRWFRLMVLLWTAAWMLLVPLVHVHPEADHRHGEAGHVHGGTVHTVWSPDLDCEFDHHRGHDQRGASSQNASSAHMHISQAGDGHSEFTFSLLNDSSDRKQVHLLLAQALAVTHAIIPDSDTSIRRQEQSADELFSARLLQDLPSRAPPAFLV